MNPHAEVAVRTQEPAMIQNIETWFLVRLGIICFTAGLVVGILACAALWFALT